MYFCEFCKKKMQEEDSANGVDYYCYNNVDDHFFGIRVKNDKISSMKLRVIDNKTKIYLKNHYQDNYSQIWTSFNPKRIKMNSIISLKETDYLKDNLLNKLKMYFTFA